MNKREGALKITDKGKSRKNLNTKRGKGGHETEKKRRGVQVEKEGRKFG